MRKTREEKAITLIALIITIVVLLILAVVAINAVTGDGIIEHATDAKKEYEEAQEIEKIQLLLNEWSLLKNIPNNNETLLSFLQDKLKGTGILVQDYGDGDVKLITSSGKIIMVTKDGKIEEQDMNYIQISSKEDIYALSRILANDAAKINYLNKDLSYSIDEDFDKFDIPEEITEQSAKIEYLQTAAYILKNDITLTIQKSAKASDYFLGIGTTGYPFKGIFNGNNKNVTLKSKDELELDGNNCTDIGLFGVTENSKILNTNITITTDIIITKSPSSVSLAGLVGKASYTEVDKCTVRITNSDVGVNYASGETTYPNYSRVGGMVSVSTKSKFSNCNVYLENSSLFAKGEELNVSPSVVWYGMFAVGGFMAHSTAGGSNDASAGQIGNIGSEVYNCNLVSTNSTQQDVIATYVKSGQEIVSGGLIGVAFNNFVIKNSSVKITNGNIVANKTGTTDTGSRYGTQAGGIVARLEHTGEIYNCSVLGNYLNILSKSPNNLSNAGGIVGMDLGPSHRDVTSLNKCSFDGSNTSNIQVEITSTDTVADSKRVGAGGIAGNTTYITQDCSVKNTTITNKSEGITNPSRIGNILGCRFLSLWQTGKYFTPRITTSQKGVLGCTYSNVDLVYTDNVTLSGY